MKAILLHETGGPEKLQFEDVPDPQPGPDEVVVRVHAASLNHRDVWIRTGRYANIKLPVIPGSDGAGEIVSAGANVDRALIGKSVILYPSTNWDGDDRAQGKDFRIIGMPDNGTYAQLIKVPVWCCIAKPEEITFEHAAALPVAGLTAYRALSTRAQVRSGETVLVTGIGGGVALFALQIAKKLGARVLVTSGSDTKIQRAVSLGADGGANYRTSEWAKLILDLTAGNGVDVVIDGAGGETYEKSLDLLKPGGRLVNYGATTGAVKELQLRKIFWKQLSLLGTTMGTKQEFEKLIGMYAASGLRPVIDTVYPLSQAADAHRRMESAEQFGKIVLQVE